MERAFGGGRVDLRIKKEKVLKDIIKYRPGRLFGLRIKYFSNVFSSMWGLMFEKERVVGVFIKEEEGFGDVHTLFCKYSLHIYLLNKDLELVDDFVMKPWGWRFPKVKYKYMIEIPRTEEVKT